MLILIPCVLHAHLPGRADILVLVELRDGKIICRREITFGEDLTRSLLLPPDPDTASRRAPPAPGKLRKKIKALLTPLRVFVNGQSAAIRVSPAAQLPKKKSLLRELRFRQTTSFVPPKPLEKTCTVRVLTGEMQLPVGEYHVCSTLSNLPEETSFVVRRKRLLLPRTSFYPRGFELELEKRPLSPGVDPNRVQVLFSFDYYRYAANLDGDRFYAKKIAKTPAPAAGTLAGAILFFLGLLLILPPGSGKALRSVAVLLSLAASGASGAAVYAVLPLSREAGAFVLPLIWAAAGTAGIGAGVCFFFSGNASRPDRLLTLARPVLYILGFLAAAAGLFAAGILHHPFLSFLYR